MLEYGDQIEIFTPLLLGTVWNWTLHGVLITQFYVYIYNFPDDSKCLKYLVYGIVFLETVQSGLSLGYCKNLEPLVTLGWASSRRFCDCRDHSIIFRASYLVLSEKKSWHICLMICLFSTFSGISEVAGSIYFQASSSGVIAEEVDLSVAAVDSDLGGTNFLWIFALDVLSDLAGRNRLDRWPYHHLNASSSEETMQ
ncbi:hypothetical protein EI94DRAFT_1710071 [Lactarius quietus]|nr:hypothetical protein EI94DRAFT_1710071 [Lactarius quietus]